MLVVVLLLVVPAPALTIENSASTNSGLTSNTVSTLVLLSAFEDDDEHENENDFMNQASGAESFLAHEAHADSSDSYAEIACRHSMIFFLRGWTVFLVRSRREERVHHFVASANPKKTYP